MRNPGYLLLDYPDESYSLCEMHKRNPIWCKRQLALESGLTVMAVSKVLLCIALIVGTAEALGDRPPARYEKFDFSRTDTRNVCFTKECIRSALTIFKNMDRQVKPCDDFYRFACGGFLKSTDINGTKDLININTVLTDKLQEQLMTSIEELSELNERKPFRLIKNLYKSCMNKTAIAEEGTVTLYETVEKLGGWPVVDGEMWNEADFDWISSIYKFRDAGHAADYFISFDISVDMKNSTRHVIELDQPKLGLSRVYLLKGADEKVIDYYRQMVNMARLLGAEDERISIELQESLLFEISLANISLSNEERRNVTRLYNPMTLDELSNNYPSIPWREYFGKLLPKNITVEENEVVIVNVPSFISDLEKLLVKTPKRVQANYAMWRAVYDSVRVFDRINDYQSAHSTDMSERKSRSKACVALVSSLLPAGVGAMYVRKYFNKETKQYTVDIVTNIREQFKKTLQQVEWLDDKTRQSALEKAAAMSSHIAYPDELLDDTKLEEFYENLELSGGNLLHSILNLSRFDNEYSLSKLRKPVNTSDWISFANSAIVNALYSLTENSIQFPAGILQGGYFSKDRPRYMNYGAIGMVIGHEITHAFDDVGRQFDKNGNLVDWWAPSTKENYLQRAECITHQYGNYTIEEFGLTLNGINTQGENIADNGGIKEAYLAYNDWVRRNKPEQQLPGLRYSPNQMFWISTANAWCTKYSPEALKRLIVSGHHSPAEFRIIGSLSNMPEFSKDFNCPLGSKMNPEKKCFVW